MSEDQNRPIGSRKQAYKLEEAILYTIPRYRVNRCIDELIIAKSLAKAYRILKITIGLEIEILRLDLT